MNNKNSLPYLIIQRSKFVKLFKDLLEKSTFFYCYDLPFFLFPKLHKINKENNISKIYLDNIYTLPFVRKSKIFIYPYKNIHTLIPLQPQIFHSTFFTIPKITVLLNSNYHKHFFTNKKFHISNKNTSLSHKQLSDNLLSILFKIKLRKYLNVSDIENHSLELLTNNDLIRIINNKCYLTKISRIILKNLFPIGIYIKARQFLAKNNNFDKFCIYLLYLLNYFDCQILWECIKKLLIGEIERIENNCKISAGAIFNVLNKLFNILSCLDKTGILPDNIKCELIKMKDLLMINEGCKLKILDSVVFKTDHVQKNVEEKERIILDTTYYSICLGNKKLSLPVGAFKLFLTLVKNQGKLLPYQQIYTTMYNREDPLFKYTLINEKSYLCKKLRALKIDTSIIENIAFIGYRLNPKKYFFKIV